MEDTVIDFGHAHPRINRLSDKIEKKDKQSLNYVNKSLDKVYYQITLARLLHYFDPVSHCFLFVMADSEYNGSSIFIFVIYYLILHFSYNKLVDKTRFLSIL